MGGFGRTTVLVNKADGNIHLKSLGESTVCVDIKPEIEDRVSPAIVVITSGAAGSLPFLQRKLTSRGVCHQAGYRAFLVSLTFAFSSAFSAMFLLHKKPKAARVLKISAALWMSSAVTSFLSVIFLNQFA